MQCLSFVVHACASMHGHACTSYVNRARRLTCTALLVNLLRVRPPCIAVHCHAINGVREEEDGNAERRMPRGGSRGPLRSCWCTLVRLAPMNIFMSGEHGARSFHLPPCLALPHQPPSVSSSFAAVLLAHPLYRRP